MNCYCSVSPFSVNDFSVSSRNCTFWVTGFFSQYFSQQKQAAVGQKYADVGHKNNISGWKQISNEHWQTVFHWNLKPFTFGPIPDDIRGLLNSYRVWVFDVKAFDVFKALMNLKIEMQNIIIIFAFDIDIKKENECMFLPKIFVWKLINFWAYLYHALIFLLYFQILLI